MKRVCEEAGSGVIASLSRRAAFGEVAVAKAWKTVFVKKIPLALPMNSLSSGRNAMNEPISMGGITSRSPAPPSLTPVMLAGHKLS
jgi:hypothetical protein